MIYFSTKVFIFITIKDIVSMTQTKLSFWHVCQNFKLRVLLSFCLSFADSSLVLLIKVLHKSEKMCRSLVFFFSLDKELKEFASARSCKESSCRHSLVAICFVLFHSALLLDISRSDTRQSNSHIQIYIRNWCAALKILLHWW